MTIINLIGTAIGRRAQNDGCKDSPHAPLKAGVLGRSQTRDIHAAFVHDIGLAMSTGHSHLARLAALPGVAGFSRALGDAITHSVHQGYMPVITDNDRSCAIGTWSGVANALRPRRPLSLIWVGAYFDNHTPRMSDSGAIHGMPLVALLNHGAAALTQIRDITPKLLPEHTVVTGARSYEPTERALFDLLGVCAIGVAGVAYNGLRVVMANAIRQVKPDMAAFGMTFDLDASDPATTPGVDTSETDGFTAQGMAQMLTAYTRDARFAAFELVGYNPRHDRGGITAYSALDLLADTAGVLYAQRHECATTA